MESNERLPMEMGIDGPVVFAPEDSGDGGSSPRLAELAVYGDGQSRAQPPDQTWPKGSVGEW